jgi:hypothetical protein
MGRKRVSKLQDFIFASSSLANPTLQSGESSRHDLEFTLLTTLELEMNFKVICPTPDTVRFRGAQDAWEQTHSFGGEDIGLRKAGFNNDVTADAQFASSGKSRDQRLSVQAEARSGEGPWEALISFDHPITIGE